MNLTYAVDRLYQTGWTPPKESKSELERLPDGRPFPSVSAVQLVMFPGYCWLTMPSQSQSPLNPSVSFFVMNWF